MDDLLNEFLTESGENIAMLDNEVVRLEQNPNDEELLANIFRLVHTIKGTCGFLGLPRLEAVAHAGETVLGKLREGELEVTPEAVTLVLAAFDQIKEILAGIEATESEPDGDDADLIARLEALAEGGTTPSVKGDGGGDVFPDDEEHFDSFEADGPSAVIGGEELIERAAELFQGKMAGDETLAHCFEGVDGESQQAKQKTFLAFVLGEPSELSHADVTVAELPFGEHGLTDHEFDLAAEHLGATLKELGVEPKQIAEAAASLSGLRDAVVSETLAAATQTGGKNDKSDEKIAVEGQSKESHIASQTIRVNVELLEDLMNLVSELVLTRNQLMQMVRGTTDSEFVVPLERLSHVTSDLQEGVMKTRMQPIGNAWAKLPRIVRDLAVDLGKKIDLEMIGADTELDRQVLELIKDPLTHMVRNSGDHGVETPDLRRKAGKPQTGKIVLNAYHEGGHIIISIVDDGAGISVDRIRAKALEQGMTTEAELSNLSDQQILQFIFKAGLSTATKVTNVSGRGVGMDVVRTNIEKIGGTVEFDTTEGKGSTFTIKIPLTLAIVSALIVEASGERFAIPQIAVSSLVRVSSTSEHKIELMNDTPVLRLRNRLLPLVSLGNVLRLSDDGETTIDQESDSFVVVTQVGNYDFGIIVDRVFDTEEIVVKPVAPILRGINIFSGNTILGDGSVIMILDPNGLAAATGEVSVADTADTDKTTSRASREDESVALLVFRAGGPEPKVVPLALVARLEEIAADTIETSNGKTVVQYRGRLMPLIKVDDSCSLRTEGRQPILVFADNRQSMGLIVDEIVDIVEERLDIELVADNPGRLGSVVVAGNATELVDTSYYLKLAFGDWFGTEMHSANDGSSGDRRVLLVDDSPFFRNMLKPLLASAGYRVTAAESADDALKLREDGEDFDIIISDIEMPGMDGFEFMEAVKEEGRWQDTPVVALTSHATPGDFQRGRQVGFTDYVGKFDRDTLLNTLSTTLSTRMERGAA